MKLDYRKLKKGDTDGLCALFLENFGDSKTAAYWNWKYYQNPAGEHMTMVAFDDSALIGSIGSIPVRMQVGSNTLLASQGVDTVISSDYRQGATFFILEARQKDLMISRGVRLTYAFSIKQTYEIFTQLLGFTGVCPIYNMSKVINPAPYLRDRLRIGPLGSVLGAVGKKAITMANRKPVMMLRDLKVEQVARFDNRFDALWREERGNYDIAVVRDSTYLNWRYIDSPTEYRVFSITRNASVEGFIVLGCYVEEVRRGRILDILVRSGNPMIIDILLHKALNYFIDAGMDIVTCWMLAYWPVFESLKKKGFVQKETPHDLMARGYKDDRLHGNLASDARWYLTMGDSDYY